MSETRFEEEMSSLDEAIRRLQTLYNRYFTGSLDRPPSLVQSQLEKRIRLHTEAAPTSYRTAEKFRLNSIVSKYHILTELWARNVRNMEEGRPATLDRRGPVAPPSQARADGELCNVNLSVNNTSPDSQECRTLYNSYLAALRASTGQDASVSYRRFYDQVRSHVDRLHEKTGATDVGFRVVLVDNRPTLKVRSGG